MRFRTIYVGITELIGAHRGLKSSHWGSKGLTDAQFKKKKSPDSCTPNEHYIRPISLTGSGTTPLSCPGYSIEKAIKIDALAGFGIYAECRENAN